MRNKYKRCTNTRRKMSSRIIHGTKQIPKKEVLRVKNWKKETQDCGQWWALVLAMWSLGHPTARRVNLPACKPKQEN